MVDLKVGVLRQNHLNEVGCTYGISRSLRSHIDRYARTTRTRKTQDRHIFRPSPPGVPGKITIFNNLKWRTITGVGIHLTRGGKRGRAKEENDSFLIKKSDYFGWGDSRDKNIGST